MATKRKQKRSKQRRAKQLPTAASIERSVSRGQLRQAVKDARTLYQSDPSDFHRSLLECVLFARAQQFERRGMRDSARQTIDELTELGINEEVVKSELPQLLLRLGKLDAMPEHAAEANTDDPSFLGQIADYAVLRPDETPAGHAELRRGALAVREALEAAARSDESLAIQALRRIDRNSPLADWVYFVRGLIAYYAKDDAVMQRHWNRLDPDRIAARIARPIRWLSSDESWEDAAPEVKLQLNQLEKQLGAASLLRPLGELKQCLRGPIDDQALLHALRSLRLASRENQAISHRVTRLVTNQLVQSGRVRLLRKAAKYMDPTPDDPHFHHAVAMALYETTDEDEYGDDYPDSAVICWRKYLHDISRARHLSADERSIVQGLIHLMIGRVLADDLRDFIEYAGIENVDARFMATPTGEFEQAIKLIPEFRGAYDSLASFLGSMGYTDKAIATLERLVQAIPGDAKALDTLVHMLFASEPDKAWKYVNALAETGRRDEELNGLALRICFNRSYQAVKAENYDEARAILDEAEAWGCMDESRLSVAAHRVILEVKADRTELDTADLAKRWKTKSLTSVHLLEASIVAHRYDLPVEDCRLLGSAWIASLGKRRNSDAIETMCRLLNGQHIPAGETWLGEQEPGEFANALASHIRKPSGIKWSREQLMAICSLLAMNETPNAESFLKYARKHHAKCGHFWFLSAALLSKRRSESACRSAIKYLSVAIRLGESDPTPENVTTAKQANAIIRTLSYAM